MKSWHRRWKSNGWNHYSLYGGTMRNRRSSSLLYCCPLESTCAKEGRLFRVKSTVVLLSSSFYCTRRGGELPAIKSCDLCIRFQILLLYVDSASSFERRSVSIPRTPLLHCVQGARAKAKVVTPSFSGEPSLDSTLCDIPSTTSSWIGSDYRAYI